jgi:Protein of unknown function (DUF4231)
LPHPSEPTSDFRVEFDDHPLLADEHSHGSVLWYIKWYRDRAPWRRRIYRATGISTIVISVLLTWVSSSNLTHKDTITSAFAVSLAFLTAMGTFYQGQRAWEKYTAAELDLQLAWWEWLAARQDAAQLPPVDATAALREAFKALRASVAQTIRAETLDYFAAVRSGLPPATSA